MKILAGKHSIIAKENLKKQNLIVIECQWLIKVAFGKFSMHWRTFPVGLKTSF